MTELTDLGICKRIAEIECLDFDCDSKRVRYWEGDDAPVASYNPLTDDALINGLIEKYNVETTPLFSGNWAATVISTYNIYDEPDYLLCKHGVVHENRKKAVCLAIIASQE